MALLDLLPGNANFWPRKPPPPALSDRAAMDTGASVAISRRRGLVFTAICILCAGAVALLDLLPGNANFWPRKPPPPAVA